MIFNRKVVIQFTQEDEQRLDGQSKICNWLYNHLLQTVKEDYRNGKVLNLLKGRNVRDYATSIKSEHLFLNTVHSSPIKNTALRLKDAYSRVFKQNNQPPKFRSWKKRWFSLYFDEANKGFKILEENQIRITLGKNKQNKQMFVYGELKENLHLRETDQIKTFRLCKQQGNIFYGIFTIERVSIKPKTQTKWLSIDPNHKNLFVSVDYKGESVEFEKLFQLKYWDGVVDHLKSKRDLCVRKAKKRNTYQSKNTYYQPSKRWKRLNEVLDKAYHRRREQLKSAMYAIANHIAKNYDVVVIGDYAPSLDTAKFDKMHRSMLNQECIGQFRRILKWVMERSGKVCKIVNEKDTTKTCCICGHKEKKSPNVRVFTCNSCHHTIYRDINSAINIAKKEHLLSGSDYTGWELSQPVYTAKWNLSNGKISFVATCSSSTSRKLNREKEIS